jgi:TatA/E family protein of Tat protein translocase
MHLPNGMELVVIMAVVLLVFGPNKLPEVARSLARAMNEFKGAVRDVTQHLDLNSIAAETRVQPPSSSTIGEARHPSEYTSVDYTRQIEAANPLPAPAGAATSSSHPYEPGDTGENRSLSIG